MNKNCPTRIDLESYSTNDLSDIENKNIQNHINDCKQCLEILEKLKFQKNKFLQEIPFEANSKIIRKIKSKPNWYINKIAAVLIISFLSIGILLNNYNTNENRVKGTTSLKLLVKRNDGQIEERKSLEFYANEHIQFIYSCSKRNNFLLLSIDEKGKISKYFSSIKDSSIVLEKGSSLPLSKSILLDNYIGTEIYFGVFSKNKISINKIVEKLKRNYKMSKLFTSINLKNQNDIILKIITTKKVIK